MQLCELVYVCVCTFKIEYVEYRESVTLCISNNAALMHWFRCLSSLMLQQNRVHRPLDKHTPQTLDDDVGFWLPDTATAAAFRLLLSAANRVCRRV